MKKTSIITLITLLFIANISIVKAGSIEDNLEELKQKYNNISSNVFLSSHPVGSIYETTSVDENTAAKMKAKYGGTWEVYGAGQTLVGVNSSDSDYNTVNKTGGSKTRSLAVGNLPAHNHSIPALSGTAASAGGHTHTLTPTGSVTSTFKGTSGTTSSNGAHTHTVTTTASTTGNQGSGTAFSTVDPYITVYRYKRTQ